MQCQKHLFSLDAKRHYLNNAYMGPLLKSAEMASIHALWRARDPSNLQTEDFFNDAEIVRLLFGRIISTKSKSISIHPSTSYSFRTILSNINPKQNGHALIVEDAFPSSYYALQRWCTENNQPFQILHRPKATASIASTWNHTILEAINEHTSIVLVPTVHWMSGLIFDLSSIADKCQSVGAKIIVDGTQSVGMLPIQVEQLGLDALITATYKWLLGPYSMCLTYLKEDYHNGQPIEDAWMSRINAQEFQNLTAYTDRLTAGASRFDMGEKSNFITMPMLKESLTKMDAWGAHTIQLYCRSLSKRLKETLQSKPTIEVAAGTSDHLFSIRLKDATAITQLKSILEQNSISVSQRGQNLRISIHVYNDEDDINALLQAIDTLH